MKNIASQGQLCIPHRPTTKTHPPTQDPVDCGILRGRTMFLILFLKYSINAEEFVPCYRCSYHLLC